ncbi:MAG: NAD(P)-dependent glycerol-3-phosphate dehydrogenase [Proteobacteria bacterium]|nr:NAD(P)-dependent glycerol-3-phosphate dehydrogenase [Pseudomonadota bacterium]
MEENEITRIGVIGAGGWGTALANLLAEKGRKVDLWVREEDVFQQIKEGRVNATFLPDVKLVPRLNPVRSFEEALSEKDVMLMAVPSHVYREVLEGLKPFLSPGMTILSATKGIENDTLKTMSQVAESLLPKEYTERVSALAGPSFAKEVAMKYPTAVTIACRDIQHAERLQRLFSTDAFRAYSTDDLIGVELSGALKNVIAIAAGIVDGLGLGHNVRAALITRGLAEMSRLGVAMGAKPLTFAGLAGLGDLVLTCTGDLSRNRTVGLKIGKGMKLQEIVSKMNMVAEGVKTSMAAHKLAQARGVDMPIIHQVYEILYLGKDPKEAARQLMTRELKAESEP